MLCWYIHTVFSFAKFWLFLTLIVISTHKKTKQENKYFVWFWCTIVWKISMLEFFEKEWNEKNVRENPTKLEYVLRCFLKVKAICKNKKNAQAQAPTWVCIKKTLFVLLILEHMMNKCFYVKLKKLSCVVLSSIRFGLYFISENYYVLLI